MLLGFPDKVVKLRKKEGLSQKELAEKVDVSIDSVRRWEQGKRTPNIAVLNKLATALNTTTEFLTEEQTEIDEKATIEVPASGMKDPTFIKEGSLIGSENVLVYEDNGRRFIFPATEKNQNWFRNLMLSSMNMNSLAMAN